MMTCFLMPSCRLVKRSESAKIFFRHAKTPFSVQTRLIKLWQRHTTGMLWIKFEQDLAHGNAIRVGEFTEDTSNGSWQQHAHHRMNNLLQRGSCQRDSEAGGTRAKSIATISSANEVGDVISARDLVAKNRDGESSPGVISSKFTDQPVNEISFKRVCQFIK